MTTRKLTAILVCAAMLMTFALGCSNTSEPAESPAGDVSASPEQSASAAPTEAASEQPAATETPSEAPAVTETPAPGHTLPLTEEKVEFSLFTGMMPPAMEYIDSMEECLVYKTLEEQTGVHISIIPIHPSVQSEKFQLMVVSGEFTDLLTQVALYSGGYTGAVNDEVIIDLNDYKEDAPLFFNLLEATPSLQKDVMLDDGSLAAFYIIDSETNIADFGPVIRTDWLSALGLENPKTYDQYYDVLKAFKTEYDATLWMPVSGNWLLDGYNIAGKYATGMANSLNCYSVVDDKVTCGWLEESYKDYLLMMNKWYSEGLINPDYISTDAASSSINNQPNEMAKLGSGKFGIWYDEITAMSSYKGFTDFDYGAAYFPTPKEGDVIHVNAKPSRVNRQGFSIATTCEDIDLAVQWCDNWYSEETTLLANWGVEGLTFNYDANGKPKFTDLILNNPEGMPVGVATFVYTADTGNFVKDRYRTTSTWNDKQLACNDLWSSNQDAAWGMPSFMSLTTDESAEYSVLMTDILTYVSEAINKFIVGYSDIESEYDTFVSTLKDMDIERCVEIQQAAYDRYMAR